LAGDSADRARIVARLHGPFLLAALGALTWFLALHWFPEHGRRGAAGAALTVAAIPAAAQAAGRVNNDLLAAVLIAAGLLVLTDLVARADQRDAAVLGCIATAAILTKSHGLLIVPPTMVGLVLLWRARRLSARIALLSLGPPVCSACAWMVWNVQRYGTLDGATAYLDRYRTYQPLPAEKFMEAIWLTAWSDYWGAYQTGSTLRLVTNLAVISLALVAAWSLAWHRPMLPVVALAGTLSVALIAALLYANHTAIVRPGGRVALPVYPALAVLVVGGWGRFSPRPLMLAPALVGWLLALAYAALWFMPFFHGR
jgi:hypothetical protein